MVRENMAGVSSKGQVGEGRARKADPRQGVRNQTAGISSSSPEAWKLASFHSK